MLRRTLWILLLWWVSASASGETLAFRQDKFIFNLTPDTDFSAGLRSLLVSDPGKPLTWTTSAARPAWFGFSASQETFTARPTTNDFGTYEFRLVVKDPSTDDGAIALVDVIVSDAPRWSRNPLPLGVLVSGKAFSLDLNKEILNPQPDLVFALSKQPSWMSLTNSGVLTGTPTDVNLGDFSGITLTATTARGSSTNTAFGSVIAEGARLRIVGSKWLAIGACRKVTVVQQNADGSALQFGFSRNLVLQLSGPAAGTTAISSESTCSQSSISSASLAAGTDRMDLYLKADAAGPVTLSVSSEPLKSASMDFFGIASDAILSLNLTVVDKSQRSLVRSCVGIDLQLTSGSGIAFAAPFPTQIDMTSESAAYQFYSDSLCSKTASNVVVATGTSSARVYLSSQTPDGVKALNASNADYEPAQTLYEFVGSGPAKLKLSLQKNAMLENECVTGSVRALHALGGDAEVTSPLLVDLIAKGQTATSGRFFLDSKCTVSTSQLTISPGTNTASFSFSFSQAGSDSVRAQSIPTILADEAAITVSMPPKFALSPVSGLSFGQLLVGVSSEKAAILINTGAPGAVGAISVSGNGFSLSPTTACAFGMQIQTGSGCEIRIKFVPQAIGAAQGSLSVAVSGGTLTIPLSGSGAPAKFVLTPAAGLMFGDIAIGGEKVLSATLSNLGSSSAIGPLSISGSGFSFASGATCQAGQVLANGASCLIPVKFTAAIPGLQIGTLSVSGAVLALRANGLAPQFSLTPASGIDFGDLQVGTAKELAAVVSNSGAPGVIGAILVIGNGFVLSTSSMCQTGQILTAGESCEVRVRFLPSSEGFQAGSLSVATPNGTLTIALRGNGQPPGTLAFDPANELNLGLVSVPGSNSACTRVVHQGGMPVTFAEAQIYPSQTMGLQSAVSCPGTPCRAGIVLSAGQACSLQVHFTPTQAGVFEEALSVLYSNGTPQRIAVTLRGSASVPPPPPTVWIQANGLTNLVKVSVYDNVTIRWGSDRALSCTMTQNDLGAKYAKNADGGTRSGTWVGPTYYDKANPGIFVAESSDPAWLDVTYTLTCKNDGGMASTSVRVRRWGYGAGGGEQASFLLGSIDEAKECAVNIRKGVSFDKNCIGGQWGTVWADGTRPPWFAKPGTGPTSGKWCTCFNPKTSPAGKPWATEQKIPLLQ